MQYNPAVSSNSPKPNQPLRRSGYPLPVILTKLGDLWRLVGVPGEVPKEVITEYENKECAKEVE